MHQHLSRRRRAAAALLVGACAALAPTLTLHTLPAEAATAGSNLAGADISWPECPKGTGIPSRQGEGRPMPRADVDYVVVGLTNGRGSSPTPA